MNTVDLKLSKGAEVSGQLLDCYDEFQLDEDILQIRLNNGWIIDVGWYPAFDLSGAFRVVGVSPDRNWETPKYSVRAKEPHEVAKRILEIIEGIDQDEIIKNSPYLSTSINSSASGTLTKSFRIEDYKVASQFVRIGVACG